MKTRDLELARGDAFLGTLPETDVQQLLNIGFLKPDDLFRTADSDSWQPLRALQAAQGGDVSRGALTRLSSSAAAVVASASRVRERITSVFDSGKERANRVTVQLLESFVPQLQEIIARVSETAPFQAAKAGLRDDDFMRKLFGATYDCLPKPVLRFVSEDRFISFCMQNRDKLMGPATPNPDIS